ncbi:hypothetical protein [Acinetobacter modestus]|uniref:portal protein n=2 Tax=Acinetobacter modestus TaxID=1776740 RepID=UPI00301703D8
MSNYHAPIESDFSEDLLSPDFMLTDEGRFLKFAHGAYQREYELQVINRNQRSIDCDFYDGDQYTSEELAEYEKRSQNPRVYNEIKPTIDWILGSERRTRMDYAVLPRTENDSEASIRKTKLCKYIDDINKSKWERSRAFEDMVKSGEGWTKIAYEINQDGDFQIILKHRHWRNIIADSSSVNPNMSDNRYMWDTQVVDIGVLAVHFPDKINLLRQDVEERAEIEDDIIEDSLITVDGRRSERVRHGTIQIDNDLDTQRRAVRVYEMWYKQTEKVKLIRGESAFNNEVYDDKNEQHKLLISDYGHKLVEVVREQMYCAMYTNNIVLYRQKSPYKHNRFPFVRRVCYIRNRDGAPYGVIRQIRDPQSDLNTRRNQALYQMATRRVIMEEGAVEDENRLADEVSRWDSIIKIKQNKRFEIQEGASLASQHIEIGEQNSAYIRQTSGVTGENRGMNTNATSGIAIQARQEQGTVITTTLTDNHILARQIEGELILSLIEQFMDKPMQFRITEDDLKTDPEFIKVNQEDDPQTDITKSQADFIVADKDYRATMRQALSEQLISTAGVISQHTGNPMLGIALLIAAIEMQDIPEKERMTEDLRKAAGMPPKNESEEEQQAREQLEQQQQAIDQERNQLAMRELQAKVNKLEAESRKIANEADLTKLRGQMEKLRAMLESINLGTAAIGTHQAALAIADDLLESADQILNLQPQAAPQQQIETDQAPQDGAFLMQQQ